MDFTLETPEARNEKVKEIIANTPPEKLTSSYLEKLTDYIIFAMDKQEKRSKKILTDNRLITVNKRETSYEGLVNQLEAGEDGLYTMITNDKNIIFQPKVSITEEDLAEVPGLRELHEEILKIEEACKTARGKRAYTLKKMLIEMRQDQYVLKGSYRRPIYCINTIRSIPKMNLDEHLTIAANGDISSNAAISLYTETSISALLCNYSRIKEDSWDKLNDDARWLMEDLDSLVERTLREDHPLYYDLLIYKIDGRSNVEIQDLLFSKYNIKHSVEYISSLWRNKIPKLLVEKAKNDWLEWHYTMEERGKWKRCSRCGKIKLAHNNFFSRNKTSRDGWYSICKECRNKKKTK